MAGKAALFLCRHYAPLFCRHGAGVAVFAGIILNNRCCREPGVRGGALEEEGRIILNDRDCRVPSIRENVTTRFMGDEAFVMNLNTVITYSLNETAARVWALIDGARSVEDIVCGILGEYNVPEPECRSSVVTIISDFLEEELVKLTDPDD